MRAHSFSILALAPFLLLACGSGDAPASGDDAGPLPIDVLDAGAAPDAAATTSNAATAPDAGSPGQDAGEAPDDAGAPDATVDACASLEAMMNRCSSLLGTAEIASSDVTACLEGMLAVRKAPACTTVAQRASFDATALGVVESALSLPRASCDFQILQYRMQWIEGYVRTARSLTNPTESVDHPTLVALDDAFWDGVYWPDRRATAFNRATLRTMQPGSLECARTALDAALYDPVAPKGSGPLTTAPLVGIVGEALSALGEGYDRTTIAHELGCSFVSCDSPELPGASTTWGALAALDDAAALRSALGDAGAAAWGSTLARLGERHAAFEAAVKDTLGVTAYSPALLSDPRVADLPAFGALVMTKNHARALLAAYATDGRYVAGPANDLYAYPAMADYAAAARGDLQLQASAIQNAQAALANAESRFDAGAPWYDVTSLETTERDALQWMASRVPPIVALRMPGVMNAIAVNPANVNALATLPDAPASFQDMAVAPQAFDDVMQAFGDVVLKTPGPVTEQVAVSFPNPSHVAVAGEPANPWHQVSPARAKLVWDAIDAGVSATITLGADDLYSVRGGDSVLACTQGAAVLRGVGLLVEYPPSAATPGNFDLSIPFQAPVEQSYVTAAARLGAFRTELPGTQAGALPVAFASDATGWTEGKVLVGAESADGASPLAPITVNFAALKNAMGGATSAPRSVTLMMNVDVAPITTGWMSWVTSCVP